MSKNETVRHPAFMLQPSDSDYMHIPALDLDHLIDQTQGDADLERQLLSLFRTQAQLILHNLQEDPTKSAQRNIEFAHLLKGAALVIGATHVAAMAAAYESLSKGSHRSPSLNILASLKEAIEAAVAAIDQRIGTAPQDGQSEN
jgi:HPt (histidine-containing phosphotransfer) domain-containing protein